ncbi:ABC transporter ATP-binding protein [Oricola sp.]|uniref:ABC transporter ATP-binding protein n=1 Tax=Oricola sp. TaxID=1979950 RepID=UPI0025E2E63A|nr:ABC transporter ATP-binding protein [Oricola sp.]MCI5073754.1 ABC transporter ATP-binding protein/permease [Oricola sp.]
MPDGAFVLLKRLFRDSLSKDRAGTYALAFACMVIVALTTASSAALMRYVVNDIFVDQNAARIAGLVFAVVAISMAKGFAAYGQALTLERIGNAITADFQIRLIGKITSLRLDYFAQNHSSTLIMRIAKAAAAPKEAILLCAASLGRDFLTVVALFCVMLYQEPLMALVVSVFAPIVVFAVIRLVRKIRALDSEEFATTAAVVAATHEASQGIRVVKAFSLEDTMRDKVAEAARGAEKRGNAITAIQATTSPVMETLGGIAIAIVILYAGWQTTSMGKTPGEYMAFLTAFLLAYEPAKRLARLNVSLQRSLNRVRMIYEVLDEPDTEEARSGTRRLDRIAGHLALEGVDFGYRDKRQILHDVSLTAAPGTVVALIGPSGVGKSTISNLIQRLYDPWSGRITIDGMDIREIDNASLRANIAVVNQDTFLFTGSILENIGLGNLRADDDAVLAAADAALVSDFARELPDGLDSMVGENGILLSGGQRQRIAIARAMLKDAPILLLDEATSALDNKSERKVQQAITELMKNRTTLVIAHRLSTIMAADRIYLMDKGTVAESGTHEELIQRNGAYTTLFGNDERTERLRTQWEVA